MNNTQQAPEEALNIVINAVEHAQSKGSWGLGDAVNIARSLDTLRFFIESVNGGKKEQAQETPAPAPDQPNSTKK
jgi:hypothetical protein